MLARLKEASLRWPSASSSACSARSSCAARAPWCASPRAGSALLAALLLDADRLLTTGQLIEVLWGAKPPTSARAALHNQVKRLRDALGESGGNRLGTQPGGYLIHLEPGELDVTRMQDLLASAQAAARGSAWEQASALAAGAVLLWRGEPLTAVDSQLLAGRIPQLTEIYLQAVEIRLEAEVNLGRHAEVIGELRRLTAEQPFREHTHALLMLALYRCGRQGEALAAYQSVRRLLLDELGSEPGPDLRALHRRILAADPALAPPERENGSSAPAGSPATEPETAQPVGPDSMPEARVGAEPERARPETPHQLPAGVRHFTGRDDQLGENSAITTVRPTPGTASATPIIIWAAPPRRSPATSEPSACFRSSAIAWPWPVPSAVSATPTASPDSHDKLATPGSRP